MAFYPWGGGQEQGAGLGRRGHGEMDKVKAGDQGAIQNVRKGENNRKKLETECRGKEEMQEVNDAKW